ncbi:MAG: succinylglutamate desuccinylase/aspartoacylase family protein [Deltaproteobacteria bacterium]|nr:succinylglutamate desuccinylase/aspartoacylase family protein [Deltaproteobacteria bacterium]
MKPPSLLHMSAPCREDFDIPFHQIGDSKLEFSIALVAGVHGNELNGVFVLSRLADYLHGVEAGHIPGLRLNGRVLIVPAVNVLGLNTRMRLWPFDKTDINRMFPGYYLGETTQRIAAAVLEATKSAPIRLDLHSGNLDFEELPHVRLYEPTEAERAKAEWFGFSSIVESRIEKILTVSLIQAWKELGGENFILRAGQAGNLQLPHCERMFQAILSFLERNEILGGKPRAEIEEDQHYFAPDKHFRVITEKAGFFVSKLEVGAWLRAGDLIGYLYDGFTGKVREEMHAPVGGLLLGLRRQPLVFEGDLIARIQCP